MFMLNLNLNIFFIVYRIEQWLIDLENSSVVGILAVKLFFLPPKQISLI